MVDMMTLAYDAAARALRVAGIEDRGGRVDELAELLYDAWQAETAIVAVVEALQRWQFEDAFSSTPPF